MISATYAALAFLPLILSSGITKPCQLPLSFRPPDVSLSSGIRSRARSSETALSSNARSLIALSSCSRAFSQIVRSTAGAGAQR